MTWADHVDPELQFITVYRHKTVKTTRRPQVVPVGEQLRLGQAAERAGVPFGRAVDGATFHAMRHTAATMLAAMGEAEAIRKNVLGHPTIASTQKYTHLRRFTRFQRMSGWPTPCRWPTS